MLSDESGRLFSSHNSVQDEIDDISKEKLGTHYDLHTQIRDLVLKIEKMTEVNLILQDKITKLGLSVADLTEKVNAVITDIPMMKSAPIELAPLPSSPFSEGEETGHRSRMDSIINGLEKLTNQNAEIVDALRGVNRKFKVDNSERLKGALSKVIE